MSAVISIGPHSIPACGLISGFGSIMLTSSNGSSTSAPAVSVRCSVSVWDPVIYCCYVSCVRSSANGARPSCTGTASMGSVSVLSGHWTSTDGRAPAGSSPTSRSSLSVAAESHSCVGDLKCVGP